MKRKIIHRLSTSDSGIGKAIITYGESALSIFYEASSIDGTTVGTVYFKFPVSYSFSSEPFSKSFLDDSYDTIIEVIDSPQLQELNRGINKCFTDVFRSRHFCVYLSNVGRLDIFAREVEILDTIQGTLGEAIDVQDIIGGM